MSFWHLTLEKKNELLRKKDEKCTELDILMKKSPSDLWIEDLDALLEKVMKNYLKFFQKSLKLKIVVNCLAKGENEIFIYFPHILI